MTKDQINVDLFNECKRLQADLTASQRKTDDLYNLFSYAESDEDVLEMTGGVPLIQWLREREERHFNQQGETK